MPAKYAILVSNGQYQNADLTRLASPVADAHALLPILCDDEIGQFEEANVTALFDATAAEIRNAIAEFFSGKHPDDLLLLYFSGHGLLDNRGQLHLAAADSNPRLPRARSVPASFLQQEMDDSRSRRQVLILDCCYAGAFRHGITKSAIGQAVDAGAAFDGDGRVVLAASDATQYAYEGGQLVGSGKPSLFTRFLVDGLQTGDADLNRDGQITADELYDYAFERVRGQQPDQTPVRWNFGMRGALPLARNPFVGERPYAPTSHSQHPPTRPGFRTLVVDPLYRGDYPTISEAVAAARPGDQILVRPGYYQEELLLEKPVEIIADKEAGEVILAGRQQSALRVKAPAGVVRGLTIRQEPGAKRFAVDIEAGSLAIEDCDITSRSLSCVSIHSGASPILRGNRIHDGKEDGVYIYNRGEGLLEGNDIFGNARSGVEIKSGGNPILRSNRIHDGKQSGVYVHNNGGGLLVENDIFGHAYASVVIRSGGSPVLRGNRIHDGKEDGVYVYDSGKGLLEDNEIYGNAYAGVAIARGGNPTIRRNRIHDGSGSGVYVYDYGKGLLEDNEIYGNAYAGVAIKSGGNPILRGNRILDGKGCGVLVSDYSEGLLENNDIFGNKYAGVEISSGGNPKLRRNRIHDNEGSGVYIDDRGKGLLEDNDIFANARSGVCIEIGDRPTIRGNRINLNGCEGIGVFGGGGIFENNDLTENGEGAWIISDRSLPRVKRKGNRE